MEVTKISEESLQKALETLGLIKAESKVEDTAAAEELKKAEETKAADKLKLENELKEALQKAEEIKAKIEGKELVKAEEVTPVAVTPAPAAEAKVDVKAIVEEIQKGFGEKIHALGLITQSKDQKIEELTKSVGDLTAFSQELASKLNMVYAQPVDRKSLSGVAPVERFEKAEGASAKNERVLSISNLKEREELSTLLYNELIEKGMDANGNPKDTELYKAVQSVELGFLGDSPQETQKFAARIRKNHGIIVSK